MRRQLKPCLREGGGVSFSEVLEDVPRGVAHWFEDLRVVGVSGLRALASEARLQLGTGRLCISRQDFTPASERAG